MGKCDVSKATEAVLRKLKQKEERGENLGITSDCPWAKLMDDVPISMMSFTPILVSSSLTQLATSRRPPPHKPGPSQGFFLLIEVFQPLLLGRRARLLVLQTDKKSDAWSQFLKALMS